ncbi:amino acid ABC transporter permease [Alkalihalobacillus sp. NPDC078783]
MFDLDLAIRSVPYVLRGLGYTMLIAFVSMGIGLVLGLFIGLARNSTFIFLRYPARLYISFIRGVPILVMLFLLYQGLPTIGIQLSAVSAALIAFTLNVAGYTAEINRAAIASIDRGQWEASRTLGFTYWHTLKRIIIPQATLVATPPLFNVFLDLIKATSLAAMITVPELMQMAKIVGGREFDYFTMYVLLAFIYWGLCTIVAIPQSYMEKRFSRYKLNG